MNTVENKISLTLPRASVIVLTRDRVQSLTRTLEALKEIDYPDFEVIVVDNDSKDGTKSVVREHGATYVYAPPKCGIGACRQIGVEHSKGNIIAFCDDDCTPTRNWLHQLVLRLINEPDLGLVGGSVINVGFPTKKGKQSGKQNKGRSRMGKNGKIVFVEDPEKAEFFGNMNLAMRRDVMNSIGGYDPFFHVLEEIDLALRIRKIGYRISFEPKAVLQHHYTGPSQKTRHFFYGASTIRLYLCMKHFPPQNIKEWLSFLYYELRLTARGLFRIARKFFRSLSKSNFGMVSSAGMDAFNIISSRVAIPWLYYRARRSQASRIRNSLNQ